MISAPRGREKDILELPNDKILSPLDFHVLDEFDGIEQFRVVQNAIDHITVKLVMRKKPDKTVVAEMRHRILEFLGSPRQLDLRFVDFMTDVDLKFKIFVRNTDNH